MDVSGDYHPRSRKRSKGVQKSGRSHAIVIREDGDLQSQTKRRSLMSRVRHFLRKFDRQPTFEEQEREVYIRKIKMNDQGGVGEGDAARGGGSANPPNIPEGPYSSADFDLNDTVRTAVTDYTDASSTARSLQGLRGPKLDWWFPAKAAFGRKKDVAVAELFNRLTRPSMNTNTKIDSFLLRDSVDADKIETRQSKWIDRGKGYFHKQRRKNKQAALVETGVHAGRSLVKLAGIRNMTWHRLRHDAFSSLISMHFSRMILMVVGAYVFAWLLFSLFWWSAFLAEPQCVTGTSGWLDALIMSISTANTIGYGMRAIKPTIGNEWDCIYSIVILSVQRLLMIIMDALLVGILFSKLSQPKKRSRTIFISDSAVVCQRDGVLKFMFRVGDARQTTIIRPVIEAYLHTFNPSRRRTTLEGEFLPNRVMPLKLEVMDESLLLPVIVSHIINESSPLYGMTKTEMEELKAEIVVTFVAVNSETGSEFAARQSYLPSEIFYGFQFCKIIKTMVEDEHKYHAIDLSKFHDIEPQKLWSNVFMTQNEISRVLMNSIGNALTIPMPVLGDNTMVISGGASLVVKNGDLRLSFRVGDVFPPLGQFLNAEVFAYYYPWRYVKTKEGEFLDYSCEELSLGTDANPNSNKLFLRMPTIVEHVIDRASPLAGWRTKDGFIADSGAEILVIVYGENQLNNKKERRQRTYKVADGHVRCGHGFCEIVSPPSANADGKPRVDYDSFHDMFRLVIPPEGRDEGVSWVYHHEPFMKREPQTQELDSSLPGFGASSAYYQGSFVQSAADERQATRQFKQTMGHSSPRFTKLSEFFPDVGQGSRDVRAGSERGSRPSSGRPSLEERYLREVEGG